MENELIVGGCEAAVTTRRRPVGTKRASTKECLFPPMHEMPLSSEIAAITVGGDNESNGTGRLFVRTPSPYYFRGESRNVPLPLSSAGTCSDSSLTPWSEKEVAEWLKELGLAEYLPIFEEHQVLSGRILMQLTEEHLKEMGVRKVGHRLALLGSLDELKRREAWGSVSGEEIVRSASLVQP